MKVLINRLPKTGPWGGGANFVNSFYKHSQKNGISIVQNLSENPDVIFVFHPLSEDGSISFEDALKHKTQNLHSKIVIRVNECDARKNTVGVDDIWREMSSHSSYSFFVSDWLKKYFEMGWRCPFNEVLINGVEKTRFEKREKISATNKKTNIVCAHWSDHKLKGQDLYEYLDDFVSKNDKFTFTYIGRTKAKLPNSTVLGALHPDELVKKLSEYDVCVNGTFWDPGPNSVIESIMAGLPTYVHNQSGGAIELAGSDHVFRNISELDKILLERNFKKNNEFFLSWEEVIKLFCDRIKKL